MYRKTSDSFILFYMSHSMGSPSLQGVKQGGTKDFCLTNFTR